MKPQHFTLEQVRAMDANSPIYKAVQPQYGLLGRNWARGKGVLCFMHKVALETGNIDIVIWVDEIPKRMPRKLEFYNCGNPDRPRYWETKPMQETYFVSLR